MSDAHHEHLYSGCIALDLGFSTSSSELCCRARRRSASREKLLLGVLSLAAGS